MSSISWLDIVVPLLLLISWVVISPFPLQVVTWIRHKRQNKHSPATNNVKKDAIDSTAEQEQLAKKSKDKGIVLSGYILPVLIHHARMLPKESQHAFRYPSIFLALNLQALENGKMQLNRVFSYSTPFQKNRWAISKIDPNGFGRKTFFGIKSSSQTHQKLSQSILLKLIFELRLRGYLSVGPQDFISLEDPLPWKQEVGQVWCIAMPTLLGMGGFNPLTIYYVYRPAAETQDEEGKVGKLWLVVLEVHNTFNERHVYICQVGVKEDEDTKGSIQRRGYQHSWTFAREFHVSPFNDRAGYYQLLMSDLWANGNDIPTLDIRLLLLTEKGEEGDDLTGQKRRKKLLATLTSNQANSNSLKPFRAALALNSKNMLKSILSQPFDLILPVSRIMWQASKLHWKRKLPVFIRPEPRGQGLKDEIEQHPDDKSGNFDGVGWPIDLNPTQPKNGNLNMSFSFSSSGAIYWNQDGFLETACFAVFEAFIRRQTLLHDDICLCIVSRNAEIQPLYYHQGYKVEKPVEKTIHLTLYLLSSSIYLDFALYTPSQARIFGSEQDRSWGTSSVSDFELFFGSSSIDTATNQPKSRRNAVAAWARRKHLQWSINRTTQSPTFDNNDTSKRVANRLITDVTNLHPYNSIDTSLAFLIALLIQVFIIRLTASLSALLHISYVRPPWAQVDEGYRKLVATAALQ